MSRKKHSDNGDYNEHTPTCSFCGKSRQEVSNLVAGFTAYICNNCVILCQDIIKNDSIKKN